MHINIFDEAFRGGKSHNFFLTLFPWPFTNSKERNRRKGSRGVLVASANRYFVAFRGNRAFRIYKSGVREFILYIYTQGGFTLSEGEGRGARYSEVVIPGTF